MTHKEKVLLLRLTEIFKVYGSGIVTGRNRLTLKNSKREIHETVKILSDRKVDDEKVRENFKLGDDTRDWQVSSARRDLKDFGIKKKNIFPVLVRPFYHQFTYYTGTTRGFHCMPRPDVMKHLLKDNICLITSNGVKGCGFSHVFISDTLVETRAFTKTIYVFPLFLYRVDKDGSITKESNLKLTVTNGSEAGTLKDAADFFFFIYGVFFSNTYRNMFENILKIGFPPLPFTRDKDVFYELSGLGKKLAGIHLMKAARIFNLTLDQYNDMENDSDPDSVYINIDVNSTGVHRLKIPRKVWKYQLGGHQIIKKILAIKRHQYRGLSQNEVNEFLNILRAVELTIEIQEKIDTRFKKIIGA